MVGNLAHILSLVNRFDPLDKPLLEEHELSLHLFSVVGLSCRHITQNSCVSLVK